MTWRFSNSCPVLFKYADNSTIVSILWPLVVFYGVAALTLFSYTKTYGRFAGVRKSGGRSNGVSGEEGAPGYSTKCHDIHMWLGRQGLLSIYITSYLSPIINETDIPCYNPPPH